MVTARYLTKKLIEPLDRKREEEVARRIERGREEGVAQGVAQGVSQGAERERRAWTEWNSRRLEAEAGGLPFDEPPPAG